MIEQKHDNSAEQKARAEENKQKAEELVKLQRRGILDPSLFVGLLNVYLLFLTAFAGFGVIAFYSGHLITLKIVFFTCIPLLLIGPIGATWYLRILFPKNPPEDVAAGKKSTLYRIMQSSISKHLANFLLRIGNSRIFKVFTFAQCIYLIAYAIYTFPQHPRYSLAVVAFYTASVSALLALLMASSSQRKVSGIIDRHLDLTKMLFDILGYTYDLAESSRVFMQAHNDAESSHQEAHESVVNALKAIDATTHAMNDTIRLLSTQIDTLSPKSANRKDDEEPNNG
jgi:hypothetical protein